jgi:hypothetical protein
MIQCGRITTSAGGNASPGRGNKGDDASWADANLNRPKIKKIRVVDSDFTN